MSSKAKSVLFFVLCFTFGLSAFFSISEDLAVQREPASVDGKIFQITSLSSQQIKSQLVQKLKVTPTIDGKKTIQFSGFSSALCKTYPNVELIFEAEGVAIAGEPPTMKILAPCLSGQDPAEMAAIQLPVDMILKQKPRNAEFSFNGYTTKMEFKNSADEWPKQWVLKKVQFKNTFGGAKTASFDNVKYSEKNDQNPIVLEF